MKTNTHLDRSPRDIEIGWGEWKPVSFGIILMRGAYDRMGLIQLTGRYLAALVAHDPGTVPLADGVRTVENLRRIEPGEGLWAAASGGPGAFAIHVPDPRRQAAGFIGMVEVDGSPALLGLRLATEDGRIVEAEHLCAYGLAEVRALRGLSETALLPLALPQKTQCH